MAALVEDMMDFANMEGVVPVLVAVSRPPLPRNLEAGKK